MRKCAMFVPGAVLTLGVFFTALISTASATVPQLINYQGILTDGGATPITVPTTVEFRIWDSDAGGTVLWMESQLVTPNSGGLFSVLLGSMSPVPDTALGGTAAYLGQSIITI